MVTHATQASQNGISDATVLKSASTGKVDVFVVSPSKIKEKPGYNSRINDNPDNVASVNELARAFADKELKDGVIDVDPLRVWYEGGEFYVSNGHRRLQAIHIANDALGAAIEGVPVRLGPKGETELDRRAYQFTLNDGEKLTPYEQGINAKAMVALGMTPAAIAQKVGKSRTHIENVLALHDLPESLQYLIKVGKASGNVVSSVYKAHGNDEQQTMEALNDVSETIEAHGGSKITAKHLRARGPNTFNLRQELATMFKDITPTPQRGGTIMDVKYTLNEWEELRRLIGF